MLMKRKYQNKSAAEKKIRLWLEENNKTIKELAEMIGISETAIHSWFKGTHMPSDLEAAKKLYELCNVENDWIKF